MIIDLLHLEGLKYNPSGLQGVNEDPKQEEKRAAFWSTIKPAHLEFWGFKKEGTAEEQVESWALILLKQRQDLPKGGVYPPGIIFGPTDLQDRL
ncbi:hypothetical protein Tco_0453551 [Tanacetum coccineum]